MPTLPLQICDSNVLPPHHHHQVGPCPSVQGVGSASYSGYEAVSAWFYSSPHFCTGTMAKIFINAMCLFQLLFQTYYCKIFALHIGSSSLSDRTIIIIYKKGVSHWLKDTPGNVLGKFLSFVVTLMI